MVFIIGREPSQNGAIGGRLRIVQLPLKKFFFLGEEGSVPRTVSREHVQLEVDDEGNCKIINRKPENPTFVNGLGILNKNVSSADRIELGSDKHQIDLASILKVVDHLLIKTYSIGHLQEIWDNYERDTEKLSRRKKIVSTLKSITCILSPLAGVLGAISEQYRVALLVVCAALAFLFVIIDNLYDKHNTQETRHLKNKLQKLYVCPNPDCKIFKGFNNYKSLIAYQKSCPTCHCRYKL